MCTEYEKAKVNFLKTLKRYNFFYESTEKIEE